MNSVILLVDDNDVQAATRKAILERAGKWVAIASDGREALELLSHSETPSKIGLIITDHFMPAMHGPELIAEVRRRGFDLPVIVLSGLPDAEFAYQGLDVTFCLKPFAPDKLIRLAHELLQQNMPRSA